MILFWEFLINNIYLNVNYFQEFSQLIFTESFFENFQMNKKKD
jgi:hypothetical protein